jgi:hypothetical protein
MKTKRHIERGRGQRQGRGQGKCQHMQQYETDWMGRTYLGCPICNRWKLQKPKHAPADGKRLAA